MAYDAAGDKATATISVNVNNLLNARQPEMDGARASRPAAVRNWVGAFPFSKTLRVGRPALREDASGVLFATPRRE
jgi:hypothetical protein